MELKGMNNKNYQIMNGHTNTENGLEINNTEYGIEWMEYHRIIIIIDN